MKEEDLSLIKRYSIMEYLERKGIRPVRRTPAYAMYRSPLREETRPSFKVDTEKNLWIGLCRRQGWKHYWPLYALGGLHALGSNLPFGAERFRVYSAQLFKDWTPYWSQPDNYKTSKRNKETDKHIRHLAAAPAGVSQKGTLYWFRKGNTISQMYQLRGKRKKIWSHRLCQFFGWLWASWW